MGSPLILFFLILLPFFLTSCIEVKQKIILNKDGSGDTKIEISIQKELISHSDGEFQKFKKEMKKKGWETVEEMERGDKYFIVFRKKFKIISELDDKEIKYIFFSQKEGPLKETYNLKIKKDPEGEFPFFYELTIKMPGRIEQTNGEKVSSNEVRWHFKTTEAKTLYAISSGFTIPIVFPLTVFILLLLLIITIATKVKSSSRRFTSRKIYCPQCGHGNISVAKFCSNCGQKLE